MGSYKTSAARAGCTLWRAVRLSKDVSITRNTSGSTVVPEPVDLRGHRQLLRHFHQLRWIGTGSVTTSEEQLQSVCISFCRDVNKLPMHSSSHGINNFIPGKQFSREISYYGSKSIGHDAGVIVKDGDVNLKEEEAQKDVLLASDESDSLSVPSSDKSAGGKSGMGLLLGALEKGMHKGQTTAQIRQYVSDGHAFTKDDSAVLISKLRKLRRNAQAAEIADWIVETKMFPWTAHDQVIRIYLKGNLGLSAEVEKIFNESPPELQTELAYNAVIRHFCERGMVKKANEWLDRLMKSGLVTHTFAFNRFLVLYKNRNMFEKVNEVLDAMTAVGISKDIFTYNILMSIKGKQNDVPGIEKVFDECMADPDVKVDPATYATLAGAYLNLGLTEKAAAALEQGERIGFDRTGDVDEVIATSWGRLGNKEKVLNMWEIMKQKQYLTPRTYAVMIETFGKLGMVDQAEVLFHEMQQTSGKVRLRQFTALLSAYANNSCFDKAEILIGGTSSMELKRTAALNHHIVCSYLKMGKLERAVAVLDEAKWKGGFPLWVTTLVILLKAVAETGDVFTAEKIFGNLKATHNRKNQAGYNYLLKAYAKAGVPADGFLLRMAADRVSPTKETYELLQLCAANAPSSVDRSESIPATASVES